MRTTVAVWLALTMVSHADARGLTGRLAYLRAGVANLGNRLAGAGLGGGTAMPSANSAATPTPAGTAGSPVLEAIDARIYAIVDDALREYDRGLSTWFSDMA
jgi:hypothetical protein